MRSLETLGVHESVAIMFPPAVLRDELDGAAPAVRVVGSADPVADCDALVTYEAEVVLGTDGPRWIHSVQAGIERVPLEALAAQDVAVTNSVGIHGAAVGETVVGYMLAFARQLHTFMKRQPAREWVRPAWDDAFTLAGESLCVVGLGAIGRGVATRAAALGVDVAGVRRTPLPVTGVETVYTPDELLEAIVTARFVVLAVPLTEETRRLVGPAELEAMRSDAYLINVARGGVVDERALIDAVAGESIAGAALDVFEEEPLPPESPLWDFEDVIVTPHEASDGREKPGLIARLVRENCRRWRAGESLANRVA